MPAFDIGSARDWTDAILGPPLRITTLLVIGLVLRWVLHRIIQRTAERLAIGRAGLDALEGRMPTAILGAGQALSHRREQRARTMASVLKSLTTAVIAAVVTLMVVEEFYDITPLLAGAGIVGVAVGFGAQSLVKDVISGIFMIVEDQYGVGDIVDVGAATGTSRAPSGTSATARSCGWGTPRRASPARWWTCRWRTRPTWRACSRCCGRRPPPWPTTRSCRMPSSASRRCGGWRRSPTTPSSSGWC
jgi:predicted membrane protein